MAELYLAGCHHLDRVSASRHPRVTAIKYNAVTPSPGDRSFSSVEADRVVAFVLEGSGMARTPVRGT